MTEITRGDVWLADLNPTRGSEQSGTRPVLILTVDTLNRVPSIDVFAVPITSTRTTYRSRLPISPPEGGLRNDSYIMCDKMRAISRLRLIEKWGQVTPNTLAQVMEIVAWMIGVEL